MKHKGKLTASLLAVASLAFQIVTVKADIASVISSPDVIKLSGTDIENSTPALADFNGDGIKEIIAGGTDGMLYVLSLVNGKWSVIWSRQTAIDLKAGGAPMGCATTNVSDFRDSPAIGDINNDGKLEIVVAVGGDPGNHRNGGVLVYRYNSAWNFSLVPGWPQPRNDTIGGGPTHSVSDGCWDGFWSTPALGDIDGDGKLDIVVEGMDRRIHAWHGDGTYVRSWPIFRDNGDHLLRGGWSSPALADINGDGRLEVIVGTDSPMWDGGGQPPYDNATLWVIKGDSTNLPGWPVRIPQIVQSSPAVGDINGDGRPEIVVGTGIGIAGTGGYKVFAFEPDGKPAPGWPQATQGNMPAPPALADLNGDGYPEVIVGCGSEADPNDAPCSRLYAWYGSGKAVLGFPTTPANNSIWSTKPNGLPYSPVVADYDGNGELDILVVNRWATGITIVHKNGTSEVNPVLRTSWAFYGPPVIDDVDGDGKLEMVIGGGISTASTGAVYVWNTTTPNTSNVQWSTFHQNQKRTGVYSKVLNKTLWLPSARKE